jgi:hypothetical protein
MTEITNFKKSQSLIEFPFIWLNNLKFFELRKSVFFIYNGHFATHFAAPWTLPLGRPQYCPPPLMPLCAVIILFLEL